MSKTFTFGSSTEEVDVVIANGDLTLENGNASLTNGVLTYNDPTSGQTGPFVELTTAQYNALTDAQKASPYVVYFIIDD